VSGQPDRRPQRKPEATGTAQYLGHGLTLAASTLFFLWLGTRADGWLGTDPWLALMGAFIGAGAGFYHMYHHLVVVPRERDGRRDG
jgi:F0F1-type ATP synthase assembly protein I